MIICALLTLKLYKKYLGHKQLNILWMNSATRWQNITYKTQTWMLLCFSVILGSLRYFCFYLFICFIKMSFSLYYYLYVLLYIYLFIFCFHFNFRKNKFFSLYSFYYYLFIFNFFFVLVIFVHKLNYIKKIEILPWQKTEIKKVYRL